MTTNCMSHPEHSTLDNLRQVLSYAHREGFRLRAITLDHTKYNEIAEEVPFAGKDSLKIQTDFGWITITNGVPNGK